MAVYSHETQTSIFKISTPTNYEFESGTFSYSFYSAFVIEGYDYGSLFDPVTEEEDYQLISQTAVLYDDFGTLSVNNSGVFGTFKITGKSTVRFNLNTSAGITFAIQGGSLASFGSPYIGYGLVNNFGGSAESTSPSVEIGSGKLFGFGGAAERVTSSYNDSSVASFYYENYGFIISQEQEYYDYEFISSSTLYDFDDFGYITTLQQDNPYGLFDFVGEASRTVQFSLTAFVGGSLFTFTGSGESISPAPEIGSSLYTFAGAATQSFTPASHVGSGVLFNFITKEERRTYSYNTSAQYIVSDEDFGVITETSPPLSQYANTPISTLANEVVSTFTPAGIIVPDDYGSVSEFVNRPDSEDYGYITAIQRRPFGFFRFVGDNSQNARFRVRYFGSGSLFTFIGSGESIAPAPEIGSSLCTFAGAATQSFTPAPHVGSGTLFNFITKEERRTYSYNTSAQYIVSDEDFRYINENYVDYDDYGNISEFVNRTDSEDYGYITGIQRRPFGFFRLISATLENSSAIYVGSGSLFTFVSGTETAGVKPPVSGLFKFSGESTEKNISNYVGSGTLFNFITKEERRTYSYNESSVVGEGVIEDYGIISENHFSSSDYGFITSFATGESYGFITDSLPAIKKPFGLFSINGAATQSSVPAPHVGSGSLFTFVSSTETTGVKPPVSGLFKFSGTAIEKNTGDYVGSGTLFNFITKEERRTYSYNGSSIILQVNLDYGFTSEPILDAEDYGDVSNNIISSSDDFGFITTSDQRPYGSLRFAGDNTQNIKFRVRYFGSGSLFTFVSGTETAGVKPPVSGLFKFSGSAAEATSPATEVGSGTLFNFITKEERRTYSYNGSSLVITEGYDYGSVSENQQSSDNYGFIINQPYRSEDYGYITSGLDRRPYGRLRFSGSASNLQQTLSHTGSGTLFAFTGAAESVGVVPPVSGLFNFFGSATESTTPATEIGSGSLFTFISKEESKTFRYVAEPVGRFRISGAASNIKSTSSEFSTGTLFAFTGASESVGAVPPVSGLLKFRSGFTENFTKLNVVTGVLRTRSTATIQDPQGKERLVGAFESTSSVPAITGGAVRVQGEVGRIFFQYGERGDGRFTIAGEAIIKTNPIHFGGGFVTVRGSSPEAIVPAPHIGSGTLFSLGGGAEAVAPAGEIGSTLFKFFGVSSVNETNREIGSGIIRVNVESSITPIWDYPVSGKLTVSGVSDNSLSRDYFGRENLKIRGIADDYFTNRFFSFGDPIRVRRTDTPHSTTRPFIASGSLFGFISAAEATGANPPERILPIKLSGGAVIARTESHFGSGSIISRHKSAIGGITLDLSSATISELADKIVGDYANIPISAPKTIITGEEPKQSLVAAYESVTASQEAKDRAIKITGSLEIETFSPINIGTGKLFGFSGAKESATFIPAKTTELFTVVGEARDRRTSSEIGSGSLFGFGSRTEAFFAAVPQEPSLIKITGSAPQIFVPAPHIGSGTISGFTGSSESSTFSPDSRALFEFTGSSKNSLTKDYSGSGTIFTFIGTARAFVYDYEITQKAFRIFGKTFESFGKSNYFGECQAQFVGASTDSKVTFEASKPTQIYII